jgi:hypothetical protein
MSNDTLAPAAGQMVSEAKVPATWLKKGDTVNGVPVLDAFWKGENDVYVVDFGFMIVEANLDTVFTGVVFA